MAATAPLSHFIRPTAQVSHHSQTPEKHVTLHDTIDLFQEGPILTMVQPVAKLTPIAPHKLHCLQRGTTLAEGSPPPLRERDFATLEDVGLHCLFLTHIEEPKHIVVMSDLQQPTNSLEI
jgi:hypothetical protein